MGFLQPQYEGTYKLVTTLKHFCMTIDPGEHKVQPKGKEQMLKCISTCKSKTNQHGGNGNYCMTPNTLLSLLYSDGAFYYPFLLYLLCALLVAGGMCSDLDCPAR